MKLSEPRVTIAIFGVAAMAVGIAMLAGKALLAVALLNMGFAAVLLCVGFLALVLAAASIGLSDI